MPATFTPELNLAKPGINESEDTWGIELNGNADKIDAAVRTDRERVAALEARCAALEEEARRASFVGEIRIWSGHISDIPNIPGGVWQLCDGTNNAPDLRDRFVIGSGGNYPQFSAGGAASWTGKVVQRVLAGLRAVGHAISEAQMPWHQHQGRTNDEGEHEHGLPGFVVGQPTAGGLAGSGSGYPSAGNVTHRAGNHGHWFTTDGRGGSQPHDHALPDLSHDHDVSVPTMPPYYALAYIRRMR